MKDPLVTVATFQKPAEASLARNRLEQAGIKTCLAGATGPGTTLQAPLETPPLELQVAATDCLNRTASFQGPGASVITSSSSTWPGLRNQDMASKAAERIPGDSIISTRMRSCCMIGSRNGGMFESRPGDRV